MSPELHYKRDDRFFLFAALVLLGVVLVGFGPSFLLRVFKGGAPLPGYLHVHGAMLTGWFVFLCIQASLVRIDSVALHQRLGQVFAAYGLLVAAAALMATFNYVGREVAMGATFDSDMAEVNSLQASGISFIDFAAALVCFNIASVLCFLALLVLAILCRRQAGDHKRYVLFASLSIVTPGFARISRMVMQTEQGPIIPLGLAGVVLAILLYDFRYARRLHRASRTALLMLFVVNGIAGLVAISSLGSQLVKALA